MKMRSAAVCLALAALAAGCCRSHAAPDGVSAVSPDGRNVIRLRVNPLAYEVLRDGRVVVAPSALGLTLDGAACAPGAYEVTGRTLSGTLETPVYKKGRISLAARETFLDAGSWGLRLVARNDGVAYRFESKRPGRVTVSGETASVTVPDRAAASWSLQTERPGCEEGRVETHAAGDVVTPKAAARICLPFVYETAGTTVAVTESDVRDYPIWNLTRRTNDTQVAFDAKFAGWPKATERVGGWGRERHLESGGRWVRVTEHADYLVETCGTRTFPWRTFILADAPAKLCEADIVYALARPADAAHDFSWVRPGKVAWDWWNDWNLDGAGVPFKAGCNTKTYEYYIDFAARTGVEYVIFDEGWSAKLDIWKFHPDVDVPHLIDYANRRGVGIILWMAWAQIAGDEARVAKHFAQLGAKGFKVDFMDRGDAGIERFLWSFAEECRKNRMLVDYHGMHRPTGMSRAYPNVLNYEGIHGLEQMKWFKNKYDMMDSDVKSFFVRLTAGPMDYTPGAMLNYPIGRYAGNNHNPGSVGTRCRQMAMMALYEAPLQMLCDSPAKYLKNMESFAFMAATPVVWADTVGLGGTPDTFAAVARRAHDGRWYAAGIANAGARDVTVATDFLGEGAWRAEIFRDAPDADVAPTHYVRETRTVRAGERIAVHLAPGGGFVMRFAR